MLKKNKKLNFSTVSDGNCPKNLVTFKKCSETILEGLTDKTKTATVSECLPQRNKISVQNVEKGTF